MVVSIVSEHGFGGAAFAGFAFAGLGIGKAPPLA